MGDSAELQRPLPKPAELITSLEKTNPQLLMQYLTETNVGDSYEINLDGMEPGEAASNLLTELILAIDAQPEKLAE